ncbi:hypothetical protein RRG08_065224 [Elysia crispata]|uniref:Phospholipid/glycerol acyltransferase domain-containing protein n=1 Tax=Elysia crispata TaxID=231223 RepID=A0AAE0YIG1_9GAST|nr:hypothetical protein RRG08_065224 [Elysia crispata]
MGFYSLIKTFLPVQLVVGYVFVMSGLVVNFLMLCSCVVWPFSRHLYRKINVHLAYAHWSQFTFLGQWWSGCEVIVYLKPEDFKYMGFEHTLSIMNHKYDIDWLMAWILCERWANLGNSKIYGKQVLKYVPLIGWAWYFTESIFLKRQWEHDKKVIQRDLKEATDYPDGYNITLLLLPEGTRFTEEKQRASLKVCRAKGYPELKHVLLPRPKGFVLSMHGLKGHFKAVLNCTVGFPTDGPAPIMMNIVNGKKLTAHFHIERIPLEDIPTETDEACAAWLRSIFKKKDDLYEGFLQKGHFPGPTVSIPRRPHDLLMFFFWFVLLALPLFWYLGSIFMSGTFTQQAVVVLVVVLASAVVRLMISVTEIEKGSSYGKTAESSSLKKSD